MLYYLIILILLFLAELLYFKLADKFNIIDKPNERSSHTSITLRGGGIIFFLGALAFFLSNNFEYPWLIIGVTLLLSVVYIIFIKKNFHFHSYILTHQ